ncbi:hypothetical protein EVAR_78842_1 [Eumeta japonica]|uniref:Uncharacterized protein n=1 Tax=Eumeta variegata TaxID=151549 RepID=A0A4C1U2U6_EUMVA|nr:hypothetical protein EVAR_78842_1 [Eumeta japonica]
MRVHTLKFNMKIVGMRKASKFAPGRGCVKKITGRSRAHAVEGASAMTRCRGRWLVPTRQLLPRMSRDQSIRKFERSNVTGIEIMACSVISRYESLRDQRDRYQRLCGCSVISRYKNLRDQRDRYRDYGLQRDQSIRKFEIQRDRYRVMAYSVISRYKNLRDQRDRYRDYGFAA